MKIGNFLSENQFPLHGIILFYKNMFEMLKA